MNLNRFIKRNLYRGIQSEHFLAALLLVLILVVFYRDVVFEGRTFLIETAKAGTMPYPPGGPFNYKGVSPGFVAQDPGAIAWQTEPFNRFISTSIKKGDFPLWNPYAGLAGSPLLADGHTGPLEPLQLIFFFSPARFWPYVVDLQLLIRFFIAGLSCYLFARRLTLNFWASIASGVLFMLANYFVIYGNHPQIKTEVLLPLVLYGYDRLVDSKDRLGFWLCALFIGWAIIAAMPESTFFALSLGSLWYFYRSILRREEKKGVFSKAKRILGRYLGSTAVGFLISAAYLLPLFENVLVSRSIHSAGAFNIPPFPLWALPNLIFQVPPSLYLQLGFLALFSLIYSILSLPDSPRYREYIIFFGSYTVIIVMAIFDFPLTNWIRELPIIDQIVFVKYPVPSIFFCLAILVGILIDGIKYIPLSYKKISLSLFIVLFIVIFLPILGNPSRSLSAYFPDKKLMYVAFKLIIVTSIVLYLLAYLYKHHKISLYILQFCLLILVASEPFFWRSRINRPSRVDPFQTPPFVNYLKDDNETYRIFALDSILYPNVSTAYQVSDIRWLNALISTRAYEFSTRFIAAEVEPLRMTGTNFPISDRMFNLLNVKYILANHLNMETIDDCPAGSTKSHAEQNQPNFGKTTLDDAIFQQNPDNKTLQEQYPNIIGSTKTSILAHPPQEFTLKILVPQIPSDLVFSIALSPEVFQSNKGDGVNFQITLMDANNEFNVFSRYIDPKNNPCDRKWFDESIDLDQWAGKEIVLKFSTNGGPVGDISWDWAYWGDIRLTTSSNPSETEKEPTQTNHYKLAYEDHDVQVYQNEDVLPRAFTVYDVINVSSFEAAMDHLADPQLDLRQTVVVENLPEEIENRINQNNQLQPASGNAKLVSSGKLDVEAYTKVPGLLVVTDQYYPGWKAYVDGEPTPIYAVDGIFRGVFLEEGTHKIEFKYRPLSFIVGGVVSICFLLTTISFLYLSHRSKNSKNE